MAVVEDVGDEGDVGDEVGAVAGGKGIVAPGEEVAATTSLNRPRFCQETRFERSPSCHPIFGTFTACDVALRPLNHLSDQLHYF